MARAFPCKSNFDKEEENAGFKLFVYIIFSKILPFT
jgi:hypothetical protein